MTKADLRTGMIVTLRNGTECVVLRNAHFYGTISVRTDKLEDDGTISVIVGYDNETWMWFSEVHDDLTVGHNFGHPYKLDIMKVESLTHPLRLPHKDGPREVLWERSEKKKYTYAQLKEILGEEFEIVKE